MPALSTIARLALEGHLPLLCDGPYAQKYGWQVEMDWNTGFCYVRMSCTSKDTPGSRDEYLLRLSFEYYNTEQPGAVFVNPQARQFGEQSEFLKWWPNVDGNPWINIQIDQSAYLKSYLCFQWTQEFKQTHAAPPDGDPTKWDPNRHNLVGLVRVVQQALDSPFYRGCRQK